MEEPASASAGTTLEKPPLMTEEEPRPYVPPGESPPEFTWQAVLAGCILGIVFGASSMYLVLKIGMTVSASIPVAVLSISIFRGFSRLFGFRSTTILENNIVQTTGSAGESIAFGIGVTMPALLILGFEMSLGRTMLVAVLGGLLGILIMIPLRRAFIVHQHKELRYPEGTACAEVLMVGEKGGASAATVFAGFGAAFLYKFLYLGMHIFEETVATPIARLKGAILSMDVAPELLGVGYIIGPRIASIMVAGGVLAYLVLVPAIYLFGGSQTTPLYPATKLIPNMRPEEIRGAYILYIGAGAVAAGGIISMFKVLPLIIRSASAGMRDVFRGGPRGPATHGASRRTERDLPLSVVLGGSLALVFIIWLAPPLHMNFLGALAIVVFGFLFVTVSSRLTGEIGSTSNPISGMTVATLLLTCLVFLFLGWTTPLDQLTALSVAAIVCIASSNGGTTSQDLKTGYLVGATPVYQQVAILIGALTSALVIGSVLNVLNAAGTVYTKKDLPATRVDLSRLEGQKEQVRDPVYSTDQSLYYVWNVPEANPEGIRPGKYLVDENGRPAYFVDPAINGVVKERDNGVPVKKFDAPKTRLMATIIDGVLNQKLAWGLVFLGVLIAITLELSGVPALPFAVGIYLPLGASTPIFVGGVARYLVDRWKRRGGEEGESDSSPGVLLSTGYIAGGTIAGVTVAFLAFSDWVTTKLNIEKSLPQWMLDYGPLLAVGSFGVLVLCQGLVAAGAFRRPSMGE